jgi:AcrR family transcriptional regulator
MSPRPKTAPDAAILEAAARLLARHGPARLRLEDVAREVGLSAATLVLRFKSKRNLLLAVAEHGITSRVESFQTRRLNSASALDVVTDIADCVREMAEEPQQLANLLAFLQLSLEDPEFRATAQRHDVTLQREVTALLNDARARGELGDVSTSALSRALIAMVRGSLFTWSSLGPPVPPERWVRDDLETLLAPHRVGSQPHAASSSRRRGTTPRVPHPRRPAPRRRPSAP